MSYDRGESQARPDVITAAGVSVRSVELASTIAAGALGAAIAAVLVDASLIVVLPAALAVAAVGALAGRRAGD